jgi:hypothetical protein
VEDPVFTPYAAPSLASAGMAFRCTRYGRQPSAILRSEIQYLSCCENRSNLFEAFKASVMLGLQSTHRQEINDF